MPIQAGDRLGPYEIVSLIGSGGMGEVYRAHDPRLQRDVAVKVLTNETADDPGLRQRFEVEARAASTINHPNIVAVYDFGEHFGFLYIVWELVEGKTLRGTKFTARQTAEIGAQIADGLAAAHAAGIIHRDLKPENIIITNDGRAKILDFGLAKRTSTGLGGRPGDETSPLTTQSQPGMIMGTIGYMSPEQVRAKDVDTRSDIFSFGLVLYEMVAGRKAFGGDTAVAVLNGILSMDPPELGPDVPLSLRQIIAHCIEKNPEMRYQSARDLAFALRSMTGSSIVTSSGVHISLREPAVPLYKRRDVLAGVAGLATTVGAFFVGRSTGQPANTNGIIFQPLTFERGSVYAARFAPDGQTVVYGARWRGQPSDLYTTRIDGPDSKAAGIPNSRLLSVSQKGELLIQTDAVGGSSAVGNMARMPMLGGAPRPMLDHVVSANWDNTGEGFAVCRRVGNVCRLEYPTNKVRYETPGICQYARFSADGKKIAFLEYPVWGDERGSVVLLNVDTNEKKVLGTRDSVQGLAWGPGGDEVWVCTSAKGASRNIEAFSLDGKSRIVLPSAAPLSMKDVAADGRVLVERRDSLAEMIGYKAGDQKGIQLAWLELSRPRDLSNDGSVIAFTEEGAGEHSWACIRKADGSPVVKVGDGDAMDLSDDGHKLLALLRTSPPQYVLYSTTSSESRKMPVGVTHPGGAVLHPDGKRFIFAGGMNEGSQLWVQDIASGQARSISPVGVSMAGRALSPDGQFVAASGLDGKLAMYPVEGGAARPVAGATATDRLIQWTKDGKALFVYDWNSTVSVKIEKLDIATGKRETFREITMLDASGINRFEVVMSADLSMVVVGIRRRIGVLEVVKGLK